MSELNENFDRNPEETQEVNETETDVSEKEREDTAEAVVSSNTKATPLPTEKKTSLAKELVDYTEVLVCAIAVVILLFSFCFRLCQVAGDSMQDTLFDGEALIVSDLFYTPKREDIIVFHQTGNLNEPVVKRVIATEGETVHVKHEYQTMVITITDADGNQTVLQEDYMKYDGIPLYLQDLTVTVPEGCLFVLGDNRNNSKDSRHPDIGLVDERRLLGKVLFRVTPFSRFGSVQ